MPTFAAPDGTVLAYHEAGSGAPVVCVPGGPMRPSAYLGDLGGLTAHRTLLRLDLRGTGSSAHPDDPGTYRCDRLADDIEALRVHLGLDRIDLLAHSAGANVAVRYMERHASHVAGLALITPSTRAVGIIVPDDARVAVARRRSEEPWFPAAFAALERLHAGTASAEDWTALAPLFHGRWDNDARAFDEADEYRRNDDAAASFSAEGAFDPDSTRAALAAFPGPVLVLAGEVDVNSPPSTMAGIADLFRDSDLVVQTGAGHYPWLDDPGAFAGTITTFLDRAL